MSAIAEHKNSEEYKTAVDAELYYKHRNPTIMRFQKFVSDQFGRKIPDVWSANNKIASNMYNYFTTQAVQYLLGNGVNFDSEATKERLGKGFDKTIQDIATDAKNGGVAFGFWNLDHIEVFALTEFVPLYDEENGALKAGIRFWQIDDTKPLRTTLYELDGYTDYIKRSGEDAVILNEKRSYKLNVVSSEADGEQIYNGENYPSFPIVPLFNTHKQSDIIGNQGTLDAYDLMASKLINNVSDADFVYWIVKNAGGMSDADLSDFVAKINTMHVYGLMSEEGEDAQPHQLEAPYQASEAALKQLKTQLYEDFMALDVHNISAGATNDQIQAAYEPINQKSDAFEFQVTAFIQGILELAGIEDSPTYTRSQMSNRAETMDAIIAAAEYLPRDYIIEKLVTLLGDADRAKDLIGARLEEDEERYVENSVESVENSEDNSGADDMTDILENAQEVVRKPLLVGQIQSLTQIVAEYQDGKYTYNQAANMLQIGVGLSEADAKKILDKAD